MSEELLSPFLLPRLLTTRTHPHPAARLGDIAEVLARRPDVVLANVPDASGKTALHMAAWKGSIIHVAYLIAKGNADVDHVSSGPHNYGKSAIFYAITRDRDHVVKLLLANGATPNIVNNKGQSVISLAASHCKPDTMAKIVEAEAAHSDVPWVNYRLTHSDELEYGDLDPRFVDTPNATAVRPAAWPYAVKPSTKKSRKGNFYRNNPGIDGAAAAGTTGGTDSTHQSSGTQSLRNLRDKIDWSQCCCLNEDAEHTVANVFMGNPALFLQSCDGDPELLLQIVFSEPVQLTHLNFIAIREDGCASAPSVVKLFANHGRMDFGDAQAIVPTQVLALTEAELNPGKTSPLKVPSFTATTTLTVFIEANQSGGPVTRLCELVAFGRPIEVAGPKRGRKQKDATMPAPVNTTALWRQFDDALEVNSPASAGAATSTPPHGAATSAWFQLVEASVAGASARKTAADFAHLIGRCSRAVLEAAPMPPANTGGDRGVSPPATGAWAWGHLRAALAQVPPLIPKPPHGSQGNQKGSAALRRGVQRCCKVMSDALVSIAPQLFATSTPTAEEMLAMCGHNLDLFFRLADVVDLAGAPSPGTLRRLAEANPGDMVLLCKLGLQFPTLSTIYEPGFQVMAHRDPKELKGRLARCGRTLCLDCLLRQRGHACFSGARLNSQSCADWCTSNVVSPNNPLQAGRRCPGGAVPSYSRLRKRPGAATSSPSSRRSGQWHGLCQRPTPSRSTWTSRWPCSTWPWRHRRWRSCWAPTSTKKRRRTSHGPSAAFGSGFARLSFCVGATAREVHASPQAQWLCAVALTGMGPPRACFSGTPHRARSSPRCSALRWPSPVATSPARRWTARTSSQLATRWRARSCASTRRPR